MKICKLDQKQITQIAHDHSPTIPTNLLYSNEKGERTIRVKQVRRRQRAAQWHSLCGVRGFLGCESACLGKKFCLPAALELFSQWHCAISQNTSAFRRNITNGFGKWKRKNQVRYRCWKYESTDFSLPFKLTAGKPWKNLPTFLQTQYSSPCSQNPPPTYFPSTPWSITLSSPYTVSSVCSSPVWIPALSNPNFVLGDISWF